MARFEEADHLSLIYLRTYLVLRTCYMQTSPFYFHHFLVNCLSDNSQRLKVFLSELTRVEGGEGEAYSKLETMRITMMQPRGVRQGLVATSALSSDQIR